MKSVRIMSVALSVLVCIIFFGDFSMAAEDSYKIIVNKSNSEKFDTVKLNEIFSDMLKQWDNGNEVIVVLYKNPKDEFHDNFSKSLVHKTGQQLKNWWRKRMFSGKSKSPKFLDDEKDVLQFVGDDKDAIGYVSEPFFQQNPSDKVKAFNIQ